MKGLSKETGVYLALGITVVSCFALSRKCKQVLKEQKLMNLQMF